MEFNPVVVPAEIIGTRWLECEYSSTILYKYFIVKAKGMKDELYIANSICPPNCKVGDRLEIVHKNSPYPGPLEEKITVRRPFETFTYNPKEGF